MTTPTTINKDNTLILSCLDTVHDFVPASRSTLGKPLVNNIILKFLTPPNFGGFTNIQRVITSFIHRSSSPSNIEHIEYKTITNKSIHKKDTNKYKGTPQIVKSAKHYLSKSTGNHFIIDKGARTGCNTTPIKNTFASWFDNAACKTTTLSTSNAKLSKTNGELLFINQITKCTTPSECISITIHNIQLDIIEKDLRPAVVPYSQIISDLISTIKPTLPQTLISLKQKLIQKFGRINKDDMSMLLMDLKRAGDSLQIATVDKDDFFVTGDYMAATIALHKQKRVLLTTIEGKKYDKFGYIHTNHTPHLPPINTTGTRQDNRQSYEKLNDSLEAIQILLKERNALYNELISNYANEIPQKTLSNRQVISVKFEIKLDPLRTQLENIDEALLREIGHVRGIYNEQTENIKKELNDIIKKIQQYTLITINTMFNTAFNEATQNFNIAAAAQTNVTAQDAATKSLLTAICYLIVIANLEKDEYISKLTNNLKKNYSPNTVDKKLNNISKQHLTLNTTQNGGASKTFSAEINEEIEAIRKVINFQLTDTKEIPKIFMEVENLRKALCKYTDYGKYFDINDPIMSITGLMYIKYLQHTNYEGNYDITNKKKEYSFQNTFNNLKKNSSEPFYVLILLKQRLLFMHYRYITYLEQKSKVLEKPSQDESTEIGLIDMKIADLNTPDDVENFFRENYWYYNKDTRIKIDLSTFNNLVEELNTDIKILNTVINETPLPDTQHPIDMVHNYPIKIDELNLTLLMKTISAQDYYNKYLQFFREFIKIMPEYTIEDDEVNPIILIEYLCGVNQINSDEPPLQFVVNELRVKQGKENHPTSTGTGTGTKKRIPLGDIGTTSRKLPKQK